MRDLLLDWHEWIEAFHIIAVIAWMAGLLYLPRLFAYHVEAKKGGELSETLKIMERRLLRIIMNPAMIAVWILGLSLLMGNPAVMGAGWFHVKFTAVILLTAFHMYLAWCRRKFQEDRNERSARFYRRINEVPTVLMVLIIIMVVVKPF